MITRIVSFTHFYMTYDNIAYLTARSVPKFRERLRDSHKGDYGRVLLIGGSFGMSGAIALTGRAALSTGSGLVRLAVPERVLPIAASHTPELMTVALPENRSGKISLDALPQIMALVDEADVVAIGPGLGRSAGLDALVMRIHRKVRKPMLIDADGLNALASFSFDHLAESFAEAAANGAWRILTPHPGEFARLWTSWKRYRSEDGDHAVTTLPARIAAARDFLLRLNVRTSPPNGGIILVFKGYETIVTDGAQVFVNTSGNPGMATAGSGDVLSGIIASLIGQRFSPLDAANLGVYLHGRTGDLALSASHIPMESMNASTLIDHIGPAIRELDTSDLQ